MRSRPPLALTRACLALLPLLAAACVSAPPITVSQTALPCAEMVEASGLLEPTPGAARPRTDTVGEIAAFGDRQTGQLDKANADKVGAGRMLKTCREWQDRALKDAQRRNSPWYKRIF